MMTICSMTAKTRMSTTIPSSQTERNQWTLTLKWTTRTRVLSKVSRSCLICDKACPVLTGTLRHR